MKYQDYSGLFDTDPAHLALLSTFQFDPDFFERRLLRCQALAKARRVAVFVDARQWQRLLRQDVPARMVNRRYLVVPVRVPQGAFHPKLNLLLTERGGQVHCGSANLTRCGSSSNLELLNAVSFGGEDPDQDGVSLALEVFRFFKRACDDADDEPGRIAREWLQETEVGLPWLQHTPATGHRSIRLLHTYDGKLWDQVADLLDAPTRLLVISPFHDKDGEMFRRAHRRWPGCRFDVLVQQKITALPVQALGDLRPSLALSELRNSSRRLHAKLLAWETPEGQGCLAGSANFTAAAFDSRNVEVCLLLSDAGELVDSLFDDELSSRPLDFDQFEAGSGEEAEPDEASCPGLKLTSALLREDGQLRVSYQARLTPRPESLRVAIRTPGEALPRATAAVRNAEGGTDTVAFDPSVLRDAHGTVLASLVAGAAGGSRESDPVWVIQEHRLTYEPSGEGPSSARQKVEETGEGLAEFLDEIGKREGVAGVIEYLRHMNIRFNDGGSGLPVGRKFRLQPRDPFHADVAPEWMLLLKGASDDLVSAILDFVERHKKTRLARHARSGNVNGRENFLDVFTAIVRLLYVYHLPARGAVKRGGLVGQVIDCVELASADPSRDDAPCQGYLFSVAKNLRDRGLLREALDSVNFTGHLRAALMIAQKVRFDPKESDRHGTPPKRPRECLPRVAASLRASFGKLGLSEPAWQDVEEALRQYRMFSDDELSGYRIEWAGR